MFEKCPKCGNIKIVGRYVNIGDDDAWRRVDCPECGFSWNEVFFFSHNEDVNTCESLDEKGEVIWGKRILFK